MLCFGAREDKSKVKETAPQSGSSHPMGVARHSDGQGAPACGCARFYVPEELRVPGEEEEALAGGKNWRRGISSSVNTARAGAVSSPRGGLSCAWGKKYGQGN